MGRRLALCGAFVMLLGSPLAARAAEVAALEFFHESFGHYFTTAYPSEAAVLDQGTIAGWTRTAVEFRVYDAPGPGLVPVCRFFTTRFAPKSSHFYTAFASECADLRNNPDWTFEAEGFHVALPTAAGACAAGQAPIYRLYNDGRGGAPNHKFTPYRSERSQFMADGWVPEGLGNDGVVFCVPSFHDVAQSRSAALAGTTWEFTYTADTPVVSRLEFGAASATGDEEFPYEVEIANRIGFAGFEPYAGKLVAVVAGDTDDQALVFTIVSPGTASGCAYVTRRLLEGLLGACRPLTGRQL